MSEMDAHNSSPMRQRRTFGDGNVNINSNSGGHDSQNENAAEGDGDFTSIDVSPMMREHDADLLESMHYASSQVSQYSPQGTPILRPKDRSLPLDDLPMLGSAAITASPMVSRPAPAMAGGTTTVSTRGSGRWEPVGGCGLPNLTNAATGTALSPRTHKKPMRMDFPDLAEQEANLQLRFVTAKSSTIVPAEDEVAIKDPPEANTAQLRQKFRRCLSGEVRHIAREEQEDIVVAGDDQAEEETTASPVSVAQEAETAIQIKKKKRDASGLAEQRRVNEAMEFAQAVGERIPMRSSDALCIIDDPEEDGDVDDDDESFEPKEIHLASHHDDPHHPDEVFAVSSHQHLPPPRSEEIVHPEQQQQAQARPQPQHQNQLEHHHHHQQQQQQQQQHKPDQIFEDRPEMEVKSEQQSPPKQVSIQKMREHVIHNRFPKRKFRPSWPFEGDSAAFLDDLDDGVGDNEVVYKGICANPPEITKRGVQRGNYAQLHRKAWLEVSDKYHRYGKNLRLYYRYWERLGFPTNNFFSWLDSKGEGAGQPLPNLEECPRSVLDADTVLYINNSQTTERYGLDIITASDGRGRVIDVDGDPVHTGRDGWIFVLRDGVMYGAEKITSILGQSKQRFHHSSFFGGKAVASAGIIITDDDGFLVRLYPHSGHYRPSEAHMQRMLFFLYRKGVDLRTFEMDTQQFRHVARDKEPKNKDTKSLSTKEDKAEKKKKTDSLHLEKAVHVACFLAHKANFIGEGVFDNIHMIRKADVTSVSEALDAVDSGGFWKTNDAGPQEDSD